MHALIGVLCDCNRRSLTNVVDCVIIQVAKYLPNSQNTVYLNSDNLLLNHLGEAPEPEAPKAKGWFW